MFRLIKDLINSLVRFMNTLSVNYEQELFNNLIHGFVLSQMGEAARMKSNNKDGKLTDLERTQLTANAIEKAAEGMRQCLGRDVAITEEDAMARVSASVKLFKMQFASSGLYDIGEIEKALGDSLGDEEYQE